MFGNYSTILDSKNVFLNAIVESSFSSASSVKYSLPLGSVPAPMVKDIFPSSDQSSTCYIHLKEFIKYKKNTKLEFITLPVLLTIGNIIKIT
jgi:hypothetical protein